MKISIDSIKDSNIKKRDILNDLKENILEYSTNLPESAEITHDPSLIFTFSSLSDFEGFYDKDYEIYNHLYEEILHHHVKLQGISLKSNSTDNFDRENYMVLRYTSNHLSPMRRYYRLIYKVNELLGFRIMNEEIQGGFLKFIESKEDFEGILVGNDEVNKWMKMFEILKIDITHPSIQKFIEIIKSYLG